MLRLVLLSYKDITGLKNIVPGQIEYEQIRELNDEDVIGFFELEYKERKERRQIAYTEAELGASVARVLSDFDLTQDKRLERLRQAVADEVRRLAQ